MTVIQREFSNPPSDSSWIDYHTERTASYRYFVITSGLGSFYTNESLDVLKRLESDVIDVFNNDWSSDEWDTTPYKYRFTYGSVYEWFAQPSTLLPNHYTFEQIALKKDGEFIELNYRNSSNVKESLNSYKDGHIIAVLRRSNFTRNMEGVWTRSVGFNSKIVDFSADDFRPTFNRMNAKHWRGFFAPIIDDMLSNEGLNRGYVTTYYGD